MKHQNRNNVNIHFIISRVGRRSKREERVKVIGATYSKHLKVCLCEDAFLSMLRMLA